ncbi:hypothetical protein [Arenibaculum sp.]|uniref:hypothetical protein n=1 Tax=Arenibaculum sp. TaxID=2865862 RepID=UPI002E110FA8|nr:hypothetical protein [Arenibaculum sp.]
MTRGEVLARYQRHRAVCAAVQEAAMANISRAGLLEAAKRLGLAHGKMLVAETEKEMASVFDLALYTARPGRSRAIERYARSRAGFPGDETGMALVLVRAWFSVFRVKGPHETAGLVVEDVLCGGEVWLVDESLERTAPEGAVLAMRLARPDAFAITCGVVVSLDQEGLEDLLDYLTGLPLPNDPEALADDPRFAVTVYRMAIDTGLMGALSYE